MTTEGRSFETAGRAKEVKGSRRECPAPVGGLFATVPIVDGRYIYAFQEINIFQVLFCLRIPSYFSLPEFACFCHRICLFAVYCMIRIRHKCNPKHAISPGPCAGILSCTSMCLETNHGRTELLTVLYCPSHCPVLCCAVLYIDSLYRTMFLVSCTSSQAHADTALPTLPSQARFANLQVCRPGPSGIIPYPQPGARQPIRNTRYLDSERRKTQSCNRKADAFVTVLYSPVQSFI